MAVVWRAPSGPLIQWSALLLTALDKVRRAAIIMAVSRSTYNNNSIELV